MMRLVVEQGKLAGHGFDLERSVIVIGRGQDCDIILDEHQVSRQHARLQHTPQGWMLLDLGSTNGTQVNGQQLKAHEPYALQPGDRVALGTAVLALQQPAVGEAVPQESQKRGKPHPALLIAGAVLIAVVLVGIVVVLVLSLQSKEDETAPGDLDPLDQVEELLPVPTLTRGHNNGFADTNPVGGHCHLPADPDRFRGHENILAGSHTASGPGHSLAYRATQAANADAGYAATACWRIPFRPSGLCQQPRNWTSE